MPNTQIVMNHAADMPPKKLRRTPEKIHQVATSTPTLTESPSLLKLKWLTTSQTCFLAKTDGNGLENRDNQFDSDGLPPPNSKANHASRRLTIARLLGVILCCGIILAGLVFRVDRLVQVDLRPHVSHPGLRRLRPGIVGLFGTGSQSRAGLISSWDSAPGSAQASLPGHTRAFVWTGIRPPGEVNTDLPRRWPPRFRIRFDGQARSHRTGVGYSPTQVYQLRWENREGIGHRVLTILGGLRGETARE